MPERAPTEDYYGTELKVQPLMASPGPMVDLEWRPEFPGADFFRLTPEQAIQLGEWLIEAGVGDTVSFKWEIAS